MKIYIRKLDRQCFTHQISIPVAVYKEFFDAVPDGTEVIIEGMSSKQKVLVPVLGATDWRLGGGLMTLLRLENNTVSDGDLMIVYKEKTAYKVEVITKVDSKYSALMSLYKTTDRHIFMSTGAGSPIVAHKNHELNQILYGAPGTGKTYDTAIYALAILENITKESVESKYSSREDLMTEYKKQIKCGNIRFTTFHQNYTYEDFVQGLKPDLKTPMKFNKVDGIFKEIANEAENNALQNFVLIIDEINRANISKVFGELITLIEPDKRKGEVNEIEVMLPLGDRFTVPNNLYILGTMNSADKSISLIDAALRRRFKFIEVPPNSNLIVDPLLKETLENINSELYKRLKSTDLLVGHSYFINKSIEDLEEIMNDRIIPLLYEYFFDNKDKVKEVLNVSLDIEKFSIEESEVKRLKIKKK